MLIKSRLRFISDPFVRARLSGRDAAYVSGESSLVKRITEVLLNLPFRNDREGYPMRPDRIG
jgi:hypothetical protein